MSYRSRDTYLFTKKTVLSGYRGSEAHGLSILPDESPEFGIDDIDMFQLYIYPLEYYFSLEGYWRKKDVFDEFFEEIDMVGYELRKAFHLLEGNNPNVITFLYNKEDHYLTKTKGGEMLLENRDVFLQKDRIKEAFCGYAHGQLKKLKKDKYRGYRRKARKKLVDKYGYDTKNAMTLIRLLKNGIELLENGKMQVYREDDRIELLDVKKGKYSIEEIKEWSDELFDKMEKAYKKSELPKKNSRKEINKLLIDIFEEEIGWES